MIGERSGEDRFLKEDVWSVYHFTGDVGYLQTRVYKSPSWWNPRKIPKLVEEITTFSLNQPLHGKSTLTASVPGEFSPQACW